MKGLITPAVLLATLGYLSFEGLRLSFAGEAFAATSMVSLSQSQQGKNIEQDFSGNGAQKEMLDGSEMMEFEGDIFADVPEHAATDKGVGQRDSLGEKSPSK
ncbi:hypothetical protein [Microbulbifer sp. PSTR4-B]|jgi:hypothetical protein|uniref:hypothetical protein n=1 Tax=unclassified Microbulbifer TaxID=2619833 RepID=UPI00403B1D1F